MTKKQWYNINGEKVTPPVQEKQMNIKNQIENIVFNQQSTQ